MTAPRANRDLSLSGMKTPRWGLTEQHPKPGVPWHGEPRTRHPWGAARTRGPPRGRGRALGTDRPVAGACRANRGQDILVHTWGWFPATPTWHTGIVGAGRDAPPPPPCPPCCVLAPKQLYRERHLNPTGDVLGCSNTPRASCKAGGHWGLGVGAGTRRPAELCLRQRARGCADPMEMGAPCPAGHMCRRGVGLTPLGGGGTSSTPHPRDCPHVPPPGTHCYGTAGCCHRCTVGTCPRVTAAQTRSRGSATPAAGRRWGANRGDSPAGAGAVEARHSRCSCHRHHPRDRFLRCCRRRLFAQLLQSGMQAGRGRRRHRLRSAADLAGLPPSLGMPARAI